MDGSLPAALEPRLFPDITPLQERFVLHFVDNAGDAIKAARAAGYSPSSARRARTDILSNDRVLQAIMVTTARALAAHTPQALGKVISLSKNARSEYVQLEASRDLLSRAGMDAPKKVNVSGGLSVSIDLG